VEQKHLENDWIESVLENCERIGISKQIIHQFIKQYLRESEEL